MPRWKAWVERPSGLIKRRMGKSEAHVRAVGLHNSLMRVENVLRDKISVIELNSYR